MKKNKNELIHISCYFRDTEIEQNNKTNTVILNAESWRDSNVKKAVDVKIQLSMDLYLDCLSKTEDESAILYFCIEDNWKALKKVFKNDNFAFLLEEDFELLLETEEGIDLIAEF